MIPENALGDILTQIGRPDARVERESLGNVNAVFFCDDDLVIRLATRARAARRMARERPLLDRMAAANMPTPRMLEEGPLAQEGWFQVATRLPGAPLTNHWPHLTTAEREHIAADLCAILDHLHALPSVDTPPQAGWIATMIAETEERLDTLSWALRDTRLGQRLIADTRATLDTAQAIPDQNFTQGPLHGDLIPNNILVENGRVTGLVDFELHRTGPRHADLHKFEFFCRRPADCGVEGDFQGLFGEVWQGYAPSIDAPLSPALFDLYDVWMFLNILHETVDGPHFSPLLSLASDVAADNGAGRTHRLFEAH